MSEKELEEPATAVLMDEQAQTQVDNARRSFANSTTTHHQPEVEQE